MSGAPQLDDCESIRQLKYTYFRLLDTKQFVELGALFTDDATTSYEAGKYAQRGRESIVNFLTTSLGDPRIIHMHNGHHPEIVVHDTDAASGTWYLEDRVIIPEFDLVLGGTALYNDRYIRVDGTWKISHTGYERIYEEQRKHSTGRLLSLSSRFDPTPEV